MTPDEKRLEAVRQRGRDSVRNPSKRQGPSAEMLARADLIIDAYLEGKREAEQEPVSNILEFPKPNTH